MQSQSSDALRALADARSLTYSAQLWWQADDDLMVARVRVGRFSTGQVGAAQCPAATAPEALALARHWAHVDAIARGLLPPAELPAGVPLAGPERRRDDTG